MKSITISDSTKIVAAASAFVGVLIFVSVLVTMVTQNLRSIGQDIIDNDVTLLERLNSWAVDTSHMRAQALAYATIGDPAARNALAADIEERVKKGSLRIERLRGLPSSYEIQVQTADAIRANEQYVGWLLPRVHTHSPISNEELRAADLLVEAFQDKLAALSKLTEQHIKQDGEQAGIVLARADVLTLLLVFLCIAAALFVGITARDLVRKIRSDNTRLLAEVEQRKRANARAVRLESALNDADDSVVMFDELGRILYANMGAERMLGRTPGELLGMRQCDLHDPFNGVDCTTLLEELKVKKLPHARLEANYRRKDGTVVPAEVQLQYQTDATGGFYISIARDISRRIEVDRLKDEFVSIVSHELRTPLTSIRGALGIVAVGGAGPIPKDAQELIRIANTNAERLVRLISDILDVEKIEAGKMDFAFATIDLVSVLQRALAENEGFASQLGVKFTFEGPEGTAMSNGDTDRLLQVVTNLLSNAVKFSRRNDKVEVSLREYEGMWRVSVKDHGPGIPLSFRPRVFAKFAQAEAAATRSQGGTGLGLSIAKMIVERHGGVIGFDTDEAKGTTFYFDIPTLQKPLRIEALPHRPHVLVCEDNLQVARYLATTLESGGFRVRIARSAAEAKERLREGEFDAMTLDLMLPDVDGVTLLQELRAEARTATLPVVVVSGRERDSSPAIASLQIIDWLSKPIDTARLFKALECTASGAHRPRVLHVEDDVDVVTIVSRVLAPIAEVSSASSQARATELLAGERYDAIILDLDLGSGPANGLSLLALIREKQGGVPIIVFSALGAGRELAGKVHKVLMKASTPNEELRDVLAKALAPAGMAA